jgi:hypothetical protein
MSLSQCGTSTLIATAKLGAAERDARQMVLAWIKRRSRKAPHAIHPPWRAGQYVTYYLERGDGTWTAFAIRLVGQTDDGAWILSADFKTARGEYTEWFRSDPDAKPEDWDPLPIRGELVRGSPTHSVEELHDDPGMQSPLAMNILLVRRAPAAIAALHNTPQPVQYPCGINQVHRFITSGPGYEKHYDLHPRVLITGVASLSIDGGRNPTVVTSFAWNDPTADGPGSYDDFVDFSRCKVVVHDSFSLSYPATWFLRLQGTRRDRDTTVQDYMAQVGGVSCACSLSVSVRRGNYDQLTQIRGATLARFADPIQGPMGTLLRQHSRPVTSADENVCAFHLQNPTIDGVAFSAVILESSGCILAQVDTFGCVAKGNPLRGPTLREMTRVLPDIVRSFRFP